jgi:recombination protein RecA
MRGERNERLRIALQELERRFGSWIVYRLRDARPRVSGPRGNAGAISSGSLSLDLATGIGGFPRGRIAEVIGPSGSGKSVLTFHLLANAQHERGFVTFIDSAHRADFEQMARCGVDLADLFLVVPENVREALEVASLLVESAGLDALVIGPLAGLIGNSHREIWDAVARLGRLNLALSASPTAVAFLTDDGAFPSTGSYLRALRHAASLRLRVTPRFPLVHPSGDVGGLRVHVETVKNRLAPAQRHTELDLRRDRGIHSEADLIDLGLAHAVFEERLSGLCFDHNVLGRGRARAIAALERDTSLAQALRDYLITLPRTLPARNQGANSALAPCPSSHPGQKENWGTPPNPGSDGTLEKGVLHAHRLPPITPPVDPGRSAPPLTPARSAPHH